MLETRYLEEIRRIHQTYTSDDSCDTDECIKFWRGF